MGIGRSQGRTLTVLLDGIAPEPVLAWLEALNERVAGILRMPAGVLGWRRVAAPDVAARGATPEVEPPAIGGEALDAARSAGRDRRVDLVFTCHRSPLPNVPCLLSKSW